MRLMIYPMQTSVRKTLVLRFGNTIFRIRNKLAWLLHRRTGHQLQDGDCKALIASPVLGLYQTCLEGSYYGF
jgi:hypothetical protein